MVNDIEIFLFSLATGTMVGALIAAFFFWIGYSLATDAEPDPQEDDPWIDIGGEAGGA